MHVSDSWLAFIVSLLQHYARVLEHTGTRKAPAKLGAAGVPVRSACNSWQAPGHAQAASQPGSCAERVQQAREPVGEHAIRSAYAVHAQGTSLAMHFASLSCT